MRVLFVKQVLLIEQTYDEYVSVVQTQKGLLYNVPKVVNLLSMGMFCEQCSAESKIKKRNR